MWRRNPWLEPNARPPAAILENPGVSGHIRPLSALAGLTAVSTVTGDAPIARRPQAAPPPKKEGPQINEDIRAARVLLIDEKGEKQGEMPIEAALDAAKEAGLDLVMVAPTNDPPVVKIADYGKQRFAEQKKKAEARKKQKSADLKEIKMRPNIDTHDYEVKGKAIRRFFEEGDKVKITMRFRGREMAHQHLGMELLAKVKEEFSDVSKVESEPRLEGRQMVMVLSPR
jgi:translation initiation factor IF-3